MKKYFDWRILIIIILVIVLGIMLKIYVSNKNNSQITNMSFSNRNENTKYSTNNEAISNSNKIIKTTSEIISELNENVELHATYYLSKCYVETNQEVKKGENILKYTNGKYLVAPYDCIITKLNIPSKSGKCTNKHYISISSTNALAVSFKVNESKISKISIGQNAKIKLSALEEKEIEGYITKISNTASNGQFTVTVSFNNDGNIKIGMTANIEI